MQRLLLIDVGAYLNAVIVDLRVDGRSLDHHSVLAVSIVDVNGEVTVVLGLGARLFVITLILLIRELLVVWDGLSGLEGDLDNLVSNLLCKAHEDAIVLFVEGESTLVQESLDVLKLGIVLVLVLDLFLKGTLQLLGSIGDLV